MTLRKLARSRVEDWAKTKRMASKQSNVDFILEQLADARDVSARKMFGEYAIYCRGKVVALFCDDQLFMKPTDAGRAFIGKVIEGAPFPGAKPWFAIGGDHWEDGEWLSELVRITERALPPPKPKSPKKTKVLAQALAKVPARPKARARALAKVPAGPKARPNAQAKAAPRAATKPQAATKRRARRS